MRKVLLLIVLVLCSCSTPDENPQHISYKVYTENYIYSNLEKGILDKINNVRVESGLVPLIINNQISWVCKEHSDYMVSLGIASHDNFQDRFNNLEQTINIYKAAENVAYKYNTPEDVVKAWLNSPEHKKNIYGDFKYIGIAITKHPIKGNYIETIYAK
jgi:uncharacterized protein YkwD